MGPSPTRGDVTGFGLPSASRLFVRFGRKTDRSAEDGTASPGPLARSFPSHLQTARPGTAGARELLSRPRDPRGALNDRTAPDLFERTTDGIGGARGSTVRRTALCRRRHREIRLIPGSGPRSFGSVDKGGPGENEPGNNGGR